MLHSAKGYSQGTCSHAGTHRMTICTFTKVIQRSIGCCAWQVVNMRRQASGGQRNDAHMRSLAGNGNGSGCMQRSVLRLLSDSTEQLQDPCSSEHVVHAAMPVDLLHMQQGILRT